MQRSREAEEEMHGRDGDPQSSSDGAWNGRESLDCLIDRIDWGEQQMEDMESDGEADDE